MKILHLITSLKIGGAEAALVNFLTYAQKNHPEHSHIVFYFYHGPNAEKISNLGISIKKISGLFHFYDPISFCKLLFFIKKARPDILHTSLWSANIIGRLIGWLLHIPVISDLHGSALDEGSFRNKLDALTAPLAQTLVAVSSQVEKAYQAAVIPKVYHKLQPQTTSKLTLIRNGIDSHSVITEALTNPLKRSDFYWAHDDFIIGAIGRLEPIKSYNLLIDAFAILYHNESIHPQIRTRLKLSLIGDGSEKERLITQAKKLGLEKIVHFAGTRTDAVKFYPLFDCFVLSSRSEGLSIALLEALCFSLPIVSTHQGTTHDVIIDHINGLLVPCNDAHALADALKILITSHQQIELFRQANRNLVQSYDLAQTTSTYMRLFEETSNKIIK